MRTLVRRLVNPVSRPALLFLLWTRRHTILHWWRSLSAEFRRRPFERQRVITLVRGLRKLSHDPQLGNHPDIRSLRVVGDHVEVELDPMAAEFARSG